jgi:hypothetical protein
MDQVHYDTAVMSDDPARWQKHTDNLDTHTHGRPNHGLYVSDLTLQGTQP